MLVDVGVLVVLVGLLVVGSVGLFVITVGLLVNIVLND